MEPETEIWVVIVEYPRYSVSNLGRVKNTETNRILRPLKQTYGYIQVGLYHEGVRKKLLLSHLVAWAFVPMAGWQGKLSGMAGTEIRYKDNDRTNCRADNLVAVTAEERRRKLDSDRINDGLAILNGG